MVLRPLTLVLACSLTAWAAIPAPSAVECTGMSMASGCPCAQRAAREALPVPAARGVCCITHPPSPRAVAHPRWRSATPPELTVAVGATYAVWLHVPRSVLTPSLALDPDPPPLQRRFPLLD